MRNMRTRPSSCDGNTNMLPLRHGANAGKSLARADALKPASLEK